MRGRRETVGRELSSAGPGEWLSAALLVSAFYLEPVAGKVPWSLALVVTCLAGGVLVAVRPRALRGVPPVLVAYVAVYVVAGLVSGLGGAEAIARYIVRPVAVGALVLFLGTAASRRRVVVAVVVLALPQVAITAGQAIDVRIENGNDAVLSADSATGTFGEYSGGPVGLVALAAVCVVAGLVLADRIDRRVALGLTVSLLAAEIFTATRAAVLFVPLVAAALVAGALMALRRTAPRRTLVAFLLVGAAAVPIVYVGTDALFPGSFSGAFTNQQTLVLGPGENPSGRKHARRGGTDNSHRGIALLPGRATQLREALRLSVRDGPRTFLLGRGFGATDYSLSTTAGTFIPEVQRTGQVWIGRVLGDGGWLALLAFFGLVAHLAWCGVRIVRRAAAPSDVALGFAMPAFAALTLMSSAYTTILDVRPYSAVFIVLGAAAFAAVRDEAGVPGPVEAGLRPRPSTPLPPRQHSTSSAPSASRAP